MFCVFATIEVQDGKQKELESIFLELKALVRKNEPGNIFYQLARDEKSPVTYYMLEAFTDMAAGEAHGNAEYFKTYRPKMTACTVGAAKVKMMEGVV